MLHVTAENCTYGPHHVMSQELRELAPRVRRECVPPVAASSGAAEALDVGLGIGKRFSVGVSTPQRRHWNGSDGFAALSLESSTPLNQTRSAVNQLAIA